MVNVSLWREFKFSLGNVLNALSSQITTLANKGPYTTLQMKDLVPETLPALQVWMRETVRISPILVDSLLQADVKDPWKLQRAMTDSSIWERDVCQSVEGLTTIFDIPLNSSNELKNYFCGSNWNRIYEELQRFLELDLGRMRRVFRRPMDPSVPYKNVTEMSWERISYISEALVQSLQKVIENDPVFQLPQGTAEQWGELIQRLMDTMSLMDLQRLGAL